MPPPRPIIPKESYIDLHFPLAGIDLSTAFDEQPNRPLPTGQGYARTTPVGVNVRAYEPTTQRARGGQRPGLQKYVQGQLNGNAHIQELNVIVATSGNIPGSGTLVPSLFFFDLSGNVGLSNGASTVWAYPWGQLVKTTIAGIGTASGGPTMMVIDGRIIGPPPTSWQWSLLQAGGLLLANPVTLPQPASSIKERDATVCTDGTNYYPVGLSVVVTSVYTFAWCAQGVDAVGNVLWSTQNTIATTSSPSMVNGDDAIPCAAISGKLYAWFGTLGIVSLNSATGGSLATLATAAAIQPAGYTVMSSDDARAALTGGAMMATPGTNLALMLQKGDNSAYGVALIARAGGAVVTLVGLAPQATNVPLWISSDGTDVYVMSRTVSVSPGTAVVQKLSGTTGAVLWTSTPFSVGGTVCYFAESTVVLTNGGLDSISLNPATGAKVGAGIGANMLALQDGGNYTGPGIPVQGTGANQANASTKQILVGVAGGTVKVAYGGLWQNVTNGATALNTIVDVIRSADNNGRLYFCDTTNFKLYDPPTNSVLPWTATQGSLPVDSNGALPRLICNWRGRLCLAGIPGLPYSIFMSAQGDATNWNYFPNQITPTQAVAFTPGNLGVMEDVVTGLIPFTDDVLYIGMDHMLYRLTGDPMDAGRLEKVSSIIGMAWGNAWTRDPYGNIYFVSNRCGIYKLAPGEQPMRISQAIEQLLSNIPLNAVVIRMAWDDQSQGVHVFITPFSAPAPAVHFFWEWRTGGWFMEVMADNTMNPLCCLSFFGDNPSDRVCLIGSWNGYVRSFQLNAPDDDGTAIASKVTIGPFLTKITDDVMLKEVQGVMGATSGPVTYAVRVGSTAELALGNSPVVSGTWGSARNLSNYVRRAGHAVYVDLSANNPWALETIRLLVAPLGKVRRRGM